MPTSSCFRPIKDIIDGHLTRESVSSILKNADEYWAHTPTGSHGAPETLDNHIALVLKYLKTLVEKHHLDVVLDELISKYLQQVQKRPEWECLGSKESQLGNSIKRLFVLSIALHDHGKINTNFQADPKKMNNPHFLGKNDSSECIGTQHSSLSGYIYLSFVLDDIYNRFQKSDQGERNLLIYLALLFSYSIYQHHSRRLKNNYWEKIGNETSLAEIMKPYLDCFYVEGIRNEKVQQLITHIKTLLEQKIFSNMPGSFQLYSMLRLNYSLLTAADYLATNEYMNGIQIEDFGVLSRERIREIISDVRHNAWIDEDAKKENYNKKVYDDLAEIQLDTPIEKSNKNLNLLRQQMATEAIRKLRAEKERRIFYLEAPTGGGKTNISMLLTLEMLEANPLLNKVYYVFPFTTLIDQTYRSIRSALKLSDQEIIALHSKSSFQQMKDEDDQYGSERLSFINRLFINFPFCLLSHIRFFEILKTNEKENNYLLHRLANSVVVIDELQSYTPKHWDKVMYFIKQYAEAYNIYFIVMSATLPKIGNLEIEGVSEDNIVYLLPDARKNYILNPNFANRVKFNFSLIDKRSEKIDLRALASKVCEASIEYAEKGHGEQKPKGSVYTIIEFIYKKTASLFKTEIEAIHNGFFDEIFVLSGTILHHRRRYIINFLKRKSNRSKKILLITTQVVEAGVDIDMDLGFKDSSLLDSDEQLAGRINRNMNKKDCQLFLFNYNKEGLIYKEDYRYQITREELSWNEKKEILNNKDFDRLYSRVISLKNQRNADHNYEGLKHYTSYIERLRYEDVSEKFRLIDKENISCFIPMDVPISVIGEAIDDELIFSESDLMFLETYEVYVSEDKKISGAEVFSIYIELIHSKLPFFTKTIQLKQLQGILAKFTFSTFASAQMQRDFIQFSDIEKSKYGYLYLEYWDKIYCENSGINDLSFDDIENQFL